METNSISKSTLKHYTRLMISFFLSLLVLSVFQYTILFFKGVVDVILGMSFVISIVHHMGYASLVGLILVPLFNFLENLNPRLGFRVVFLVLLFLLGIEGLLVTYYCAFYVPLGADLLDYNFTDLMIGASNSLGMLPSIILATLIMIASFFGCYRVTSKFYHHINKMYPFTIVLFSLFVITLFTEGKPINQNKTQYLGKHLFTETIERTNYNSKVEYPLVRTPNTEDVLGDYFELRKEKPNIVFVVVEGLGKGFIGKEAPYGGFTPFLDSLSRKSLYWDNFLSNTTQTSGTIPSLIGSLPFGEEGFLNLSYFPNKLTLFGVLKNNGYHTSYYQGTNSSLNNLDNFLQSESVDFILDRSGFGNGYQLQVEDAGGSSWGYPDKELFRKGMSLPKPNTQPRMEVYMTANLRSPFLLSNQKYYEALVSKLLIDSNSDEKTQEVIEDNRNVFASLLYSDEALKAFFSAYQKNNDFGNTLFIITGSHSLDSDIPLKNTLGSFHVPLIIYSPMLKTAKTFSSISSHLDVAPSLLALLNKTYEIKLPKKVAWLGGALDMHRRFRSIKDIPLKTDKDGTMEFIHGNKFFSDGDAFDIDSDLNLKLVLGQKGNLGRKLNDFMAMNVYVTEKNKIIPDELVIFPFRKEAFEHNEMVWLNSVFNGSNFDKAYSTARSFAFDKESEKALLLCRYILSEIPSHLDAHILMGRINAWEGNYSESIRILKTCIGLNPSYLDSYEALLDVYFWSEKTEAAIRLISLMDKNEIDTSAITSKINRARKAAEKKHLSTFNQKSSNQKEVETELVLSDI
ncbi:LTA synthase family protein [uncultured Kriegella sp.]|uniref:LTA synthase family protein n=1 Tax=uncultured Kriegella sp. TaxID=1798910 RepID=UPI0030DD6D07|tara:strand:- start:151237 stop:153630 length:2394 start_codon:yes stop_codon:yes gene_type:complete